MAFLTRLRQSDLQASITGDLWKRILGSGGSATKAGVAVGEDSALTVSAFWAGIRILSEDVAKLPLGLYQRQPDGGKKEAIDHPSHNLVTSEPNGWQTPFEFLQQGQALIDLRGDSFSHIVRVGREIRELIPIETNRVTVRQLTDWDLEYDIRGEDKPRKSKDILHVRGFSLDGFRSVSMLKYARETIGLTLATQHHGARLFANGAKASGALTHPDTLSDEAAERLRLSVEENISRDNVHRVLLLEEGMTWQQITMTSEDAQFLETRKFQLREFARFLRIPPHKLADLEQATFSNIEHQAKEYVDDSLIPRLLRWEQRLNRSLLTPAERKDFFFRFNVDAILRGDMKTRYGSYTQAIDAGWMSPNDAREKENLNRKPGLDEYRRQTDKTTAKPAPGQEPSEDEHRRRR